MANTFHGPLDTNIAIVAPQCMPDGTINFNIGSDRSGNSGTRSHRQLVPFSTVPFPRDADFVNRPEILEWLREKCAGAGARAALVGLGGVGKSQLAIQFAHDIQDASPQTFVFWVHASSRTQFEQAYRDIADRLQLPERSDPNANVLRLVSNWLRDKANGDWFMVLDNVDRVDIFSPPRKRRLDEASTDVQTSLATYLPQSNGSILVTSRNRDAAAGLVSYNRIKDVLAMNESEGLQLLHNKLCQPPQEMSAAKLLDTLGHIPLAITQAAAFINRRKRISVADYLNDFHGNDKKRERLLDYDLGDLRRDESASNSILTTWHISFEQIRQERPSAAELLSLMSFFNPQGIPEWILRQSGKEPTEAADVEDEDEEDMNSKFEEDLDILLAYSLISKTAEKDTYEMHPLVQFCMRVWLSSFGEVDQWHHRFVVLMAQGLHLCDYNQRAKFRQLLPHAEPLFDSTPAKETLRIWAIALIYSACRICLSGRYTTAHQIVEKALSATEKALGFGDDLTLNIAALQVTMLEKGNQLQEAEQLGQRVLQEAEKEPGKHNHLIMTMTQILVGILRTQGRYDESEKLVQPIVEAHKEIRDPFMLGDLACVLEKLDQLEDSEEYFRQAIEKFKELLGERHSTTLRHTSGLAEVLAKQGQWLEAEKTFRQTLEANQEQLGERHLDTLQNISCLAGALERQGKSLEAEKLFRQAIEGYKELGEHNNRTAQAIVDLSLMLIHQSRNEEAEKLLREVLSGSTKGEEYNFGELLCVYVLAHLLRGLGRYTEAVEMYQQACTGCNLQYGPQHPHTMSCYEQLAALQKKMEQAGIGEGQAYTQPAQDRPE